MRVVNQYHLNEYRISESADGRLWWDAHAGLGNQIGGPCFVYGNLLILGARCSEENGFLKLEFFNHLKKLPLWRRTRYYCFGSTLFDVSSGRKVSEQQWRQLVSVPAPRRGVDADNGEGRTRGGFRLWRYQISILPNGDMTWTSCSGAGQTIGGPVTIESDVLLIGPSVVAGPRGNKKAFIKALRSLPPWNRTTFWCRSLALKPVLPVGKKTQPYSSVTTAKHRKQKNRVVRSDHAKNTDPVWRRFTKSCSNTVDAVKARWPKRILPKIRRRRDIDNDVG